MSKSENQKIKLLCLKDLLMNKTDEQHTLSVAQIITYLANLDIKAERKSIYDDIEMLCNYGVDIICQRGRENRYYVASRDFELAELKLLADSVASSAFITEKKSSVLIKKIGNLTSQYEATQIYRQVYVERRVKANNEKIYYNVDCIHRAINDGKAISFKYFTYDIKKQKQYKSSEKYYCFPYAMTYSNEHYYVIAYYEKYNGISSFRVDRMDCVSLEPIEVPHLKGVKEFDITDYNRKNFSMFKGIQKVVTMQFENSLIDTVLDRFGNEVTLRQTAPEHFEIAVSLGVSPQFFGWILGLGIKAKIIAPESVKEELKSYIKQIENQY